MSRDADAAAVQPAVPAHRLWGGRFSVPPAPALEQLNRSLAVDVRLWAEDVEASRAWVQGLLRAHVLTWDEAHALDVGLATVARRLAQGGFESAPDEDIHTLVERMLYEEVGDVAGKLHTGRSRNDQVATDARLWALRAGKRLDAELRALEQVLLNQAEVTIDLLIPAYTHLRRAQPIRVAHWLMAQLWAFERDRQRLAGALERVGVLPLGSGAVSGSGFPIDRTLLKELLADFHMCDDRRASVARRGRPDSVLVRGVRFREAAGGVHDGL
jgi:argininosuccinate lyase